MAEQKVESKDGKPIDIETMKVKLIIVCKEQSKLEAVATFLNRRGWEAQITTKIKDALAMVSTTKPDFVMISANHPNPKLTKFPAILKSTFQVPSIGFSETGDSKSLGILQNLAVSYRMHGFVSGPNTQRRIKQILREIYAVDGPKTERKALNHGDDNDTIVMQKTPSAARESSMVSIKGESQQERKSSLAYMPTSKQEGGEFGTSLGDDDFEGAQQVSGKNFGPNGRGFGVGSGEMGSGGGFGIAEMGGVETEDADFANDDFDNFTEANPLGTESGTIAEKLPPTVTSKEGKEPSVIGSIDGEDFSLSSEEVSSIVDGVKKDVADADRRRAGLPPLDDKKTSTSGVGGVSGSAAEAGGVSGLNPAANTLNSTNGTQANKANERSFTKDPQKVTFFEKLVKKILNDLSSGREFVERRVSTVDRIVTISVQSPQTTGHLVITTSATTRGLRDLANSLRESLEDFLRQEGKMYEFGSPAMVLCSEYRFFETREESLEFCHVTAVDNGEVAVKFLDAKQGFPRLHKDNNDEKLRVDAEEVPAERPVDFKFYIHLEKNDRYIMLVKEGGALSQKYKERLKEFSKQLFIDEKDAEKLKRFFSTSELLEILKVKSFRVEYAPLTPGKKKEAA